MILTGLQNANYFYDAYEFPKDIKFPMPKPPHSLHISASKITRSGTHVVAYCSISHHYEQIVKMITDGLPRVTQSSRNKDLSFTLEESACLRSITEETSLRSDATPLSQLQKYQCTHQLIASMAFKGMIGVEGKYACFAPPLRSHTVKINADIPLKIEQFLAGAQLLKGRKANSDTQAMVWFQGNLHLLRQTKSNTNGHNLWIPITSIGKESTNGALIMNFIYDNLPGIYEFTKIMSDFRMLEKTLNAANTPSNQRTPQISNDKICANSDPEKCSDKIHKSGHKYTNTHFGKIDAFPTYLNDRIGSLGLRCQVRFVHRSGLFRNKICIFSPRYVRRSIFQSQTWINSWKNHRLLKVPPQTNAKVVADRFIELGAEGTLCDPIE
ncbi:putative Bgh-specific protein [Blumeria hordei DH14]|uniref:Putative Bgh-specific protein n=1 Tax=Blumeria graminis f. sp. hordei (strain DH14) TaxID=546991 RepID=N1JQJ5_BLUG1|nr:putative Bgh-specific protein [Blumeria hordei DH14]